MRTQELPRKISHSRWKWVTLGHSSEEGEEKRWACHLGGGLAMRRERKEGVACLTGPQPTL